MTRTYSYVVRYDSGFAPNPFYGVCTLATCKPSLRKGAKVNDWIVGSGSGDKTIRRGGHLVYAMRVTEIVSFDEYSADPRFAKKKPFRQGSRKQSCGDNVYFRDGTESPWRQRDSFHSQADGTLNLDHVRRDTGVNRVLVSSDFVYFGGAGPQFPKELVDQTGRALCKKGRGLNAFSEAPLLEKLEVWIDSLGVSGYQGPPLEWLTLRG